MPFVVLNTSCKVESSYGRSPVVVERATPDVDHLLAAVVDGGRCADLLAEREVLLERRPHGLPARCDEAIDIDSRHGSDGSGIQASSTIALSVSICCTASGPTGLTDSTVTPASLKAPTRSLM